MSRWTLGVPDRSRASSRLTESGGYCVANAFARAFSSIVADAIAAFGITKPVATWHVIFFAFMRITEIRIARALLRGTQRHLAERARINRRTVVNIESGKHIPNSSTLQSIRRAFEAAGIEFAETGTPVRR